MILSALFWTFPLMGKSVDPLDDIYSVVVGAMIFLLIGIFLVSRIRHQREEPKQREDEVSMNLFQQLYRDRLISYEEYQAIKKNLRDHLVYEVYENEIAKSVSKRSVRRKETFSEQDKEERLRQLLSRKK